MIAVRLVGVGGEVVVNNPECLRTIVIVRVDDGKGAVHHAPGGQDRVGGAPRLFPPVGDGVAGGEVVQSLERIPDMHPLADAVAHSLPEIRLHLLLDDKNNGFKPGLPGIIDGIVYDALSMSTHRVHLLQPAIAAAHTRSQNYQNWFLHSASLHHSVYGPRTAPAGRI